VHKPYVPWHPVPQYAGVLPLFPLERRMDEGSKEVQLTSIRRLNSIALRRTRGM
jgi:hypothetical protein